MCHAQREEVHPGHDFEAISTPRPTLQSLMGLASAAEFTVVTFIEIRLEGEDADGSSGLEDWQVAWWLAQDKRIADMDHISAQDPNWACPICSEGMEAEESHGWLVRICTPCEEAGSQAREPDETTEAEKARGEQEGHIYHEACLRKWLLKKNSCPVCRQSPVMPPPTGESGRPSRPSRPAFAPASVSPEARPRGAGHPSTGQTGQ